MGAFNFLKYENQIWWKGRRAYEILGRSGQPIPGRQRYLHRFAHVRARRWSLYHQQEKQHELCHKLDDGTSLRVSSGE